MLTHLRATREITCLRFVASEPHQVQYPQCNPCEGFLWLQSRMLLMDYCYGLKETIMDYRKPP